MSTSSPPSPALTPEPKPKKSIWLFGVPVMYLLTMMIWCFWSLLTLLSLTADDEPGLWAVMVAYIPASVVGLLLYGLAYRENDTRLALVSVLIPAMVVVIFTLLIVTN